MVQPRKPFTAEIQAQRRATDKNPTAGTPYYDGPERRFRSSQGADGRQTELESISAQLASVNNKLDLLLRLDHAEIERIHLEISDIAGRIRATKAEIAAIRHPLADEDRFRTAALELSHVVKATEAATNGIMTQAERIEEIVGEMKFIAKDQFMSTKLNDISELLVKLYEMCNFQDLTGQRINKVVKVLTFIEERIEAMMALWNKHEFESMPLPPSTTKTDDGLELHGPESEDSTTNQADIDKLFG